mmetsp:Transcript_12961/g.22874  ORF Transcript_12961/g.22874 Transcript_12961/m.22874 type:complete len:243 (-) Transcript_12961:1249-1977(-)
MSILTSLSAVSRPASCGTRRLFRMLVTSSLMLASRGLDVLLLALASPAAVTPGDPCALTSSSTAPTLLLLPLLLASWSCCPCCSAPAATLGPARPLDQARSRALSMRGGKLGLVEGLVSDWSESILKSSLWHRSAWNVCRISPWSSLLASYMSGKDLAMWAHTGCCDSPMSARPQYTLHSSTGPNLGSWLCMAWSNSVNCWFPGCTMKVPKAVKSMAKSTGFMLRALEVKLRTMSPSASPGW